MSVQKRCLSCAEEGGHQRPSEAIRGHQRSSEAVHELRRGVRRCQWDIGEAMAEVISEAIRGEQSEVIREALREVISGN